jgi:hypothetical protein
MKSFQKLWEKVRQDDENNSEDSAMSAIRNGIGIRNEFWDDFLSLLNDSKGVADLLDVPFEKVSAWTERIKHNITKVNQADERLVPKERQKLLKTGLPE